MENNQSKTNIDVSTFAILRVILIGLGLVFLYYIRGVLTIVFIASIFAAALNPVVNKLKARGIRPGLGVLMIYILLFLVITTAVVLLIPPISDQIQGLYKTFPDILKKLPIDPGKLGKLSFLELWQQSEMFSLDSAQKIFNVLLGVLSGLFGGVVFFFIVLVVIYYMIVEQETLKAMVTAIIPSNCRDYFFGLSNRIQAKLSAWLMGQLILCLIIGGLAYIGLLIARVDYALVLALFAGLTEFIPYVGPYLGAVPAVFLTYTTTTPGRTLFVAIWFLLIQRAENDIIIPKLMQKAIGINPAISIIGLLIGAEVGGITGALLAIPVTAAISETVRYHLEQKEKG